MLRTDIAHDFPNARFPLVDDDAEHLLMLERYLSSMGFEYNSAADGKQAAELLKSERFDVVISDIQMPQFDGIKLLRTIKSLHPESDVILMTGYSQTYTFTDVIREGATDYLEKPFTKDAVRAKIFRILKERALLADYNLELVQRREIEKHLHKKSADLAKRVRELDCLYQISSIMEQKKGRPDEIFQATIQ